MAAGIALRAMDIVGRSKGVHIVSGLGNHCGKHCRAASFRVNHGEVLMQMVYPSKQARCEMLGHKSFLNIMAKVF